MTALTHTERFRLEAKGYTIHDGSAECPISNPDYQPGVVFLDGEYLLEGDCRAKNIDWTTVLGYKMRFFSYTGQGYNCPRRKEP